MMNCTEYIDCPPPSNYPLIGFNSQTSDGQTWSSMGFAPGTVPPLNWVVGLPVGFAIRHSTISQSDADSLAYAAALANAQQTWTPPGNIPSVIPGDNTVFDFIEADNVPPIV